MSFGIRLEILAATTEIQDPAAANCSNAVSKVKEYFKLPREN